MKGLEINIVQFSISCVFHIVEENYFGRILKEITRMLTIS
jgi:hypothetical protein